MTVKEFNRAWLACMVKMQAQGIDIEKVEVVIEANDDGILEVARVEVEEACVDNPDYHKHGKSGGEREFTLIIEGV